MQGSKEQRSRETKTLNAKHEENTMRSKACGATAMLAGGTGWSCDRYVLLTESGFGTKGLGPSYGGKQRSQKEKGQCQI